MSRIPENVAALQKPGTTCIMYMGQETVSYPQLELPRPFARGDDPEVPLQGRVYGWCWPLHIKPLDEVRENFHVSATLLALWVGRSRDDLALD